MRNKKSIFIVALFVMVVFCVMGTSVQAAEKRLIIATASTGGTWYPLGGGIANLISKYIPNTSASARPSGASVENIRNVGTGRVDLAIVMPDAAYFAYKGEADFKADRKWENIRGLFATFPIDAYFYSVEGTGIKTLADLKGKKVAVGAAGSGTEVFNRMILEMYGINYDNIAEQFLSAPEATEALKDGTIHAAMYLLGTPAPTIMDLVTQRKTNFLSMEPDKIQAFCKKYPFYTPSNIKAGTYKDQKTDFTTVQYYGIFICNKDMDEKLVYDIMKTVFDHQPELAQIHVAFKDIKLATATKSIAIPLHPGAERFLKERGIIK
ncbi:MAG: TRAP transporter solute receptor TAXI family [Syntrophaceae bacterium]|nr:MAG: TRAP transporter solute receptor TAXI family [Syntrophaceae bacterium]